MAYTITNTRGQIVTVVNDNDVDSSHTSLSFIGRGLKSYGEIQQNNLIKLLENSANILEPATPVDGQLWFNTQTNKLAVCVDKDNKTWRTVNYINIGTQPENITIGETWWDTTDNTLYLWNGTKPVKIGPTENDNYSVHTETKTTINNATEKSTSFRVPVETGEYRLMDAVIIIKENAVAGKAFVEKIKLVAYNINGITNIIGSPDHELIAQSNDIPVDLWKVTPEPRTGEIIFNVECTLADPTDTNQLTCTLRVESTKLPA